MRKWISAGKGKYGLRYREHPEKVVGVGRSKRPLRYYKAYFKYEGQFVTDIFGWEDEFSGGREEIEKIAFELKINRKLRTPPFTYREMIEENDKKLEEKRAQEKIIAEKKDALTETKFSIVFDSYIRSKPKNRYFSEMKGFYSNWLQDMLGNKILSDIRLSDFQKIQHKMEKLERAPRTIKTVKEIVRQVYNYAREHELYEGKVPYTNFLKKLNLNNRREAYYTHDQAASLLRALKERSHQTYCMALLSLNSGMRFGEIAGLLWQHIDLERRTIFVIDPKNGENRAVYMVDRVKEMFEGIEKGERDEFVFLSKTGSKMTKISNTFPKTVEALGFNRGIDDRRLRLGFHSLRHTAASWMANQGVEMHVIAKVLGHKTLAMTMRYSHINDKAVKEAMSVLEDHSRDFGSESD